MLPNNSNIKSIIGLNEKQIIVVQYDFINQIELDINNNFKLLYTRDLKLLTFYKFPNNRLLAKEKGIFFNKIFTKIGNIIFNNLKKQF